MSRQPDNAPRSIGDGKGDDLSIAEQTVKAIQNGLPCPPIDALPDSDPSAVSAALDAYRDNGGRVSAKIRLDADRMADEYGEVQVVGGILWAMEKKRPIQQAWAWIREKTWSEVRLSVKEIEKATDSNYEKNKRIAAECAARDAARIAAGETL